MTQIYRKRQQNEKNFGNWETLENGGRRYYYEVPGRLSWKARYLKEVDSKEITIRFWQEIYNESGKLVEIREKFPVDKGHQNIQR